MNQMPAGWYVDADGATRWWDGLGWTPHTQPAPALIPSGGRSADWSPDLPQIGSARHTMPRSDGVRLWMVVAAGSVVVAVMALVIMIMLHAGVDEVGGAGSVFGGGPPALGVA